ncbi:MAG: galactose ABC transporter substrate-binding protein [Eubacteriales bacterium]|nr:galactose ABC transporter substrate-binding protein [Eubacteriales bacterium]
MKKFLSILLAAILVLSIAGSAMAEGKAVVSWYTFGDIYLTSVRNALNEALTAKGIEVLDKDSNAVQTQQNEDLDSAVLSGTNALVVNLVESGSIGVAEKLLEIGKNAGLPVVFFNRAVSQDDAEAKAMFESYEKSIFVGTNFEDAGRMQGDMIGAYVLENYDKLDLNGDGEISYVMFKGDEANQEAIARTKFGVENADAILTAAGKKPLKFYDENNTAKYLVDQNGTWSSAAATDYMQTILAQYSEANNNMVELVICNNDGMAFGAIAALQQVGYNKSKDEKVIPVFGVDAVEEAQKMIKDGIMTGTIKQDAVGMADAVATITANLIEGKDKLEGLNENYKVVDGWFVQIPYAVYAGE